MSSKDRSSLRREFLGLGLSGAMIGLAGCIDGIAPDSLSGDDGSSAATDLDNAGFGFDYDGEAQRVTIEFTGGAQIAAGTLQIRYNDERRATWAELGSTTAGPDEDIEPGASAVVGPDVLNWETPIRGSGLIRLVYVGKETPATLERFRLSGSTASDESAIFSDEFDDETFTETWETLPTDDEVIEERAEGYLYHESPRDYNEGGGLLSTESFAASGVKTLRVEMKTRESSYWGYGFRIRFDDADSSEMGIKEHRWQANDDFRFRPPGGEPTSLARATTETERTTYAITVDFDAGTVVDVTRGEDSFNPDVTFSQDFDSFRIKLGEGRGHKVEFHSVELLPAEPRTETEPGATTEFEEDFESGTYADNWSIVWKNFGDRDPTNEWSVVQDGLLSGDYALYLDAFGDPNIIATDERIVRLDRDFELTVRYYLPDSDNRGPSVRLLDSDENGSEGDYITAEEANVGRIANTDPPFGQGDVFQLLGAEAEISSSSVDEPHQIRVVRRGEEITGYHDGNEAVSLDVGDVEWDLTKAYRLALRNSGRFGGESEIYYDDVRYTTDI